jgi:hypothetical protein
MAEVASCSVIGFLALVVSIFALMGCGAQQTVTPKAIAFEPSIESCPVAPEDCTAVKAKLLHESREARNHRCPVGKPDVLIRPGGTLVCVANLSSISSARRGTPVRRRFKRAERTLSPPSGQGKSFSFKLPALPVTGSATTGIKGRDQT